MALLLAVIIWGLALMTGYFCFHDDWWMPEGISTSSGPIDSQLFVTMVVVGVAFFAAQGLLGLFVLKYRARPGERAAYLHGNNVIEIGGALLTAVVFISLAVAGQRVWASVHLVESPPGAVHIEVTGEQFLWNVRYPGPDGTFGRTAPQFIEKVGNTVGIDPADPAGADDILALNNIAVPVNEPVELILRSKDVIHDLSLPNVRLKQDAVPGLAVPLRFTATRTGSYEMNCAELCGFGHYQMRAFLHVKERPDYEAWLQELAAQP
jgi:cytochrome c oxidase subunit 2